MTITVHSLHELSNGLLPIRDDLCGKPLDGCDKFVANHQQAMVLARNVGFDDGARRILDRFVVCGLDFF
ncbi:hypothetical protein AU195_11215 [Mycobacterium sp. IS-1496]|nr:hypothetical protein AU195_11215 [Mycobacterium sp. IS-1496]